MDKETVYLKKNKEERYSRVPRLSDTRYSKGNGDMQAAKRDYNAPPTGGRQI